MDEDRGPFPLPKDVSLRTPEEDGDVIISTGGYELADERREDAIYPITSISIPLFLEGEQSRVQN